MKKVCKDCGLELDISEFYRASVKGSQEISYYSRCKSCYLEHSRAIKTGEEEKDRKGKPNFKRIPYNHLEKDNLEAYKAGMSYGQWQAQKYLKEQKRREKGE